MTTIGNANESDSENNRLFKSYRVIPELWNELGILLVSYERKKFVGLKNILVNNTKNTEEERQQRHIAIAIIGGEKQ